VICAKLALLAADGHTTARSPDPWTCQPTASDWRRRLAAEGVAGLEDRARSGRPRRFPPQEVAQVKAVACELPKQHGLALSRFQSI
jgi:transposase